MDSKNNCSKHGNPWRFNNSLISDIWIKEIKKEIKFIEINESKNTIQQDFLNGMFLPNH